MKRKYFSALLMGALTIASVSTFTSCKDYDDDISSLQSQIDKLNEMVSKIQGQIDNGAVLTGVNPVENGVKLTLSNGAIYTITNGKDGAKGADGAAGVPGTPGKDADIWKIGDDGFWYKNEKRQIGRLLVLMVLPELQAQLVRMVSTMFQIHKPVHSSFMAMVIRMHMIQVFLILLLVSLPQLGLRMS